MDTKLKRRSNYSPFTIRYSLIAVLLGGLSVNATAQDRPAAFVDAASVVPGLIVDARYAGAHNFVGRPIDGYQAPRCLLTRPAAEALTGVAKDLAQQVAAMRPAYIVREDVPADVVEKERRIAEQITRDEGKPEQAIPKIVDGRLNSYFKDVVLTEQAFVKDQKTTVRQVLAAGGVSVTGFARFQVGQA